MARRLNRRYSKKQYRHGTLGDCRAVQSAKSRILNGGGIPVEEIPAMLPHSSHIPGGGDVEGWLWITGSNGKTYWIQMDFGDEPW